MSQSGAPPYILINSFRPTARTDERKYRKNEKKKRKAGREEVRKKIK